MADADADAERRQRLFRLNQGFVEFVPHNKALGLRFTGFDVGKARLLLPYDPKLVGNPETGVLHGGAISALLDACCGAAVFIKVGGTGSVATLDLRIDYLRPATPNQDVTCVAECFKATRNVAFVRALAYDGDEDDPVAAAAGSFMIFETTARSAGEKP